MLKSTGSKEYTEAAVSSRRDGVSSETPSPRGTSMTAVRKGVAWGVSTYGWAER